LIVFLCLLDGKFHEAKNLGRVCGEAKSRELALTTKNNNNNKKTLKLWYLEQYPVCGRQPINPC
jgi:hypothetical protein